MKKLSIAIITIFVLLIAGSAFAASTLLYTPGTATLTIESGASAKVQMDITMASVGMSQMVRFLGSIEGGNLPAGWITSSSYYQFISRYNPVVSTTLTIAVPADTAPGVYSGYVYSWAGFTAINRGAGMYVEITVQSPCNATADIDLTSLSPDVIWPPNHKMVDVVAEGFVTNPIGCEMHILYYDIVDEYSVYTASGEILFDADGNFSVPIPVEASRLGQDKDGRHYSITISAENDGGISTLGPFDVLVPHDMSDKIK